MENNSFVFYETMEKQLSVLPDNLQLKFFQIITAYGLHETEPEFGDSTDLERVLHSLWIGLKKDIDYTKSRRAVNIENGKKGGRPTKNDLTFEEKPTNNLGFEQKTDQNLNVNVNVNDNVNVKERENKQEKVLENNSETENENKTLSLNSSTQNNRQNNNHAKEFVPPTVEQVSDYCQKEHININPQSFVNFYTSNNWFVGQHKMTCWQASVKTWASRSNSNSYPQKISTSFSQNTNNIAEKSPETIGVQQLALKKYSENKNMPFSKCLELAKKELKEGVAV